MYELYFIDVSEMVSNPIRTGVQRVVVKIIENMPRGLLMPFRVQDAHHVAILDPAIFDLFSKFFRENTPSPRAEAATLGGSNFASSEEENLIRLLGGYPVAVLQTDRFFRRARRIINLESFSNDARSAFYISCPDQFRFKVYHFIHDFLLFEHPSHFPQLNWRYALNNISLLEAYSVAGGFFVSTPALQGACSKYLGRQKSDIGIVHFGGDITARAAKRKIGRQRRVVTVGTIEPRKFPLEVASALDELAVRHPDIECIMIGSIGWITPDTHAALESIFNSKRVKHLHGLGDQSLIEIAHDSDVAIFVSKVEGFGLPAIEFAYAGIPLVTNRAVPASALLQGSNAITLDEVTVPAIIEAVEVQLRIGGDHSSYYHWTWEDTASEVISFCGGDGVDTPITSQSGRWNIASSLAKEFRYATNDWESLKAVVFQRLFVVAGESDSLGPLRISTGEARDRVLEEISEIVSDNRFLFHWSDLLAAMPILERWLQYLFSGSPLESISLAYSSFLGRPIDARAASEVAGLVDLPMRLERMTQLINSDEARVYLGTYSTDALLHVISGGYKLIQSVTASRPVWADVFDSLRLSNWLLSDVTGAEGMYKSGIHCLAILLHFSARRMRTGSVEDMVIESLAKVALRLELIPIRTTQRTSIDEGAIAGVPLGTLESTTHGGDGEYNHEDQKSARVISRLVPLHSTLLSDGWYDIESNGSTFRWMAGSSSVINPEKNRLVRSVTLEINAVYGSDAPMLTASFDGQPGECLVENVIGGGWRAYLSPGQPAAKREVLRISSEVTDSPSRAEQSPDNRELSIAVTGVTFSYEVM